MKKSKKKVNGKPVSRADAQKTARAKQSVDMVKSLQNGNRRYSTRNKVEALLILQKNGYNLSKTSRETGVSTNALKIWEEQYGDKVNDGFNSMLSAGRDVEVQKIRNEILGTELDEEIIAAAKRLALSESDYISVAKHAKFLAMERLILQIPKTTDARVLLEITERLHRIERGDSDGEGNKNKSLTFIEIVNKQLETIARENNTEEAEFEDLQ